MKNIYLPEIAEILEVRPETPDSNTFTLRFRDPAVQQAFDYRPGQFVEVSAFGMGEAPFCLASSPTRPGSFQITVRAAGTVTRAMHQMGPGRQVGVRGPLGNSFPVEEMAGRDLLFIAGGIGLPPLRSLIWNVLDRRSDFGEVTILYGARTPSDLVYQDELKDWESRSDVNFRVTVDQGDPSWQGHVGMVPTLFDQVELKPNGSTAFLCGPPVMIKFVIQDLLGRGFSDDRIISTLERQMKCGVGKCNHCCIGHKYVCQDGPVFTYKQIKGLLEQA